MILQTVRKKYSFLKVNLFFAPDYGLYMSNWHFKMHSYQQTIQ